MKNRSRLQISSELLRHAINGELQTRLMYKTNLSYDSLKEYLAVLTANGLLTFDADHKIYKTTPKGRKFIATYDKLSI
jgi:predicted transcriptional regulator